MGALYFSTGRFVEAERLYKRALSISEKALKPGHPDMATLLNNLVVLYNTQGKRARAQHYHKRLMSTWDSALKPESSDTSPATQGTTQKEKPYSGRVYASKFSRSFHRRDCVELTGKEEEIIDFKSRKHAMRDGAIPCKICKP
jgi:tetratricopeptide (TPR) repeat protein